MFSRSPLVLFILLATLSLTACGSDTISSAQQSVKSAVAEKDPADMPTFTMDNISELAKDPNSYEGAAVEDVIGKVWDFEKTDEGLLGLISFDIESFDHDLVVLFAEDAEIEDGDYIKVRAGQVMGEYDGVTVLNEPLVAPQVQIDDFEIVTSEAFDPALVTYPSREGLVGDTKVTITELQLAENSTRVYVTYENVSDDETFIPDVSIVADGEQVEEEPPAELVSDLESPASSLSPGGSSSGVLLFEPVPESALEDGVIKLHFSYDDDSYERVEVTTTYE